MSSASEGSAALRPLATRFFRRSAETLARDLLGRYVVRREPDPDSSRSPEPLVLRIVETEAYLGVGDRASHAWRGRPTDRTRVLFEPGGVAYVYLIYGLHSMLNVVAGRRGDGSAVLVRAGQPIAGAERMRELRGLGPGTGTEALASGPGKLCQALAVDRGCNGLALGAGSGGGEPLVICRGRRVAERHVAVGTRIGIDYAGAAALWPLRFAEAGNRHVSRPWPW